VVLEGESETLEMKGAQSKCSGIGGSARVNRLEEGVEQMHSVAARRGDHCLLIGTNSAIPLKE
jgi:hypothetical protein